MAVRELWKAIFNPAAAAAAKSLQSCQTLCNPIDSSPPGSPVPGILQARILEWVAISYSINPAALCLITHFHWLDPQSICFAGFLSSWGLGLRATLSSQCQLSWQWPRASLSLREEAYRWAGQQSPDFSLYQLRSLGQGPSCPTLSRFLGWKKRITIITSRQWGWISQSSWSMRIT